MVDHVLEHVRRHRGPGTAPSLGRRPVHRIGRAGAVDRDRAPGQPGDRRRAVDPGRGLGAAQHRATTPRAGRRRGQLGRAAGRRRHRGRRARRAAGAPARTRRRRRHQPAVRARRARSRGSRRCATTTPTLALYGGPDGLEVVRPLAEQAALLLRPGGLLAGRARRRAGRGRGGVRRPGRPARPARSDGADPPAHRARRDARPVRRPRAPRCAPGHRAAAWRDVTDHLDLAGRPRHTSAIRAAGRMAP